MCYGTSVHCMAPPQQQMSHQKKGESINLLALAAIATNYVIDEPHPTRHDSGASDSGEDTEAYSQQNGDSDTDTSTVNYDESSPSPPPMMQRVAQPSVQRCLQPQPHTMPHPHYVAMAQHHPKYIPQQQQLFQQHQAQHQQTPMHQQQTMHQHQPMHQHQQYVLLSTPPQPQPDMFYNPQQVVVASTAGSASAGGISSDGAVSAEEVNQWMKYAPVNGQKMWKCLKCKRDYKTKYVCKRHVEAHLVHKPYSCQNCNRRFQRLDQLQRHRKKILKCKPARLCRISSVPQHLRPQPVALHYQGSSPPQSNVAYVTPPQVV